MKLSSNPSIATAKQLLEKSGLPFSDLDTNQLAHFLYCGTEANPSGIVGLEIFDSVALLRSLAVSGEVQGKGYGKSLVVAVEKHARKNGVKELYLLTETAETFFKELDYKIIQRDLAPESIKNTNEFANLCPDSAAFMFKQLKD